jgi:quinol monooxygenase YgiN
MFVQIIEFRTSKVDEIQRAGEEYVERARGVTTARRALVCEDRDNPGHYFQVVFFDSYESAMKNSELPATQEVAGKMAELVDEPPAFYNLDVIDDRTLPS